MNYQDTNGQSISDAFTEFHNDNPQVYTLFESEVFRAIKYGKRKLSAKMIINFIRWNMYLQTSSATPYKINDAYTAYYARLFVSKFPEWDGLFELRRLRAA